MIRHKKRRHSTDTHKSRRHYYKLMLAAGYEPHILRVEANGRIHRYYTREAGPIAINSNNLSGSRIDN